MYLHTEHQGYRPRALRRNKPQVRAQPRPRLRRGGATGVAHQGRRFPAQQERQRDFGIPYSAGYDSRRGAHAPAPNQVPNLMMELVHAFDLDVRSGRDPFQREADFHMRFERIHPFEDGNGRTGRILLFRGLIASNLPPAVISIDDRATYLDLIATRTCQDSRTCSRNSPRTRRRAWKSSRRSPRKIGKPAERRGATSATHGRQHRLDVTRLAVRPPSATRATSQGSRRRSRRCPPR
ncbi:Fic family protein [uncultured Parolsenella sp.]|uniref:Fic family protein n=1 Tax=uncultured Parolsenella sp. TaxID=2083008 RepID=UPI0035A5DB63